MVSASFLSQLKTESPKSDLLPMEEAPPYSEDKPFLLSGQTGSMPVFPLQPERTIAHANYLVILLEAYLHLFFVCREQFTKIIHDGWRGHTHYFYPS